MASGGKTEREHPQIGSRIRTEPGAEFILVPISIQGLMVDLKKTVEL